MREKLLAQWAEKYERIEYEMKRYEKKRETLERQQKKLVMDVWQHSFTLAIVLLFFLALAAITGDIPSVFLLFYVPVLALLAVFTIGRSIILLAKKIALLLHHKRKNLPFLYPRPIWINSNYPTYIPPNYYTEHLCIEWLMDKYSFEMDQLKIIRREIEQASEQDYNDLQERLNEIIIYEIVGRAK